MNIKKALLKNKNKAYCIDKISYFSQDSILNNVADALNKNFKIIQYYIKTVSDKENINTAHKIRQLCSIYNALLIINSRIDIAQIVHADGVCLFDNDISLDDAKKLFHDDEKIIAICSNSIESALNAQNDDVDYICIDPSGYSYVKSNIKALNKVKYIELNR